MTDQKNGFGSLKQRVGMILIKVYCGEKLKSFDWSLILIQFSDNSSITTPCYVQSAPNLSSVKE